ncbi:hypothetical protein [Azotobacter beijerinckii]|uniref:hypothetical protein n=1 Tax=Azotobacter beijerinckii TaxID=170623 RepID=UPI001160AF31|nr:hypothetical protein [Azotobacter beijerinckii]
MELQLKRNELIAWLKTVAGATVLSISLAGQLAELQTNISSPYRLATALEQKVDFLDDGPYLVKYEQAQDDDEQALPYTTFAMAMTFKAELANHPGKFVGGYDALIAAASGYEYLAKVSKESYGLVGHLLISLPQAPDELAALKEVLAATSVVYAFPDGTGTLNLGNVKMGNGIYS